jgi:hypothetical protein
VRTKLTNSALAGSQLQHLNTGKKPTLVQQISSEMHDSSNILVHSLPVHPTALDGYRIDKVWNIQISTAVLQRVALSGFRRPPRPSIPDPTYVIAPTHKHPLPLCNANATSIPITAALAAHVSGLSCKVIQMLLLNQTALLEGC